MRVADANVLLRYLLNDHDQLSEQAARIIAEGVHTYPAVIAEVVYVLAGPYALSREDIRTVVGDLINEIEIDDHDTLKLALDYYAEDNVDFVDGLLIAHAIIGGADIASFDKKLNTLIARDRQREGNSPTLS